MPAPSERRRLGPAAAEVAIAGVALLRLHAQRDPTTAGEILDEIRRSLARADDGDSEEVRTPFLDVVSGYARWSEVYDAPGNPLIECEEPSIRPILDGLSGDPLLDAACGTGRHVEYLVIRGHQLIGVDVVPQMIEKARTKTPNPDYRIGELTALPVEDAEVGGAVCGLALEHVADLAAVYAGLGRVVASGGAVVISTMHPVLRSVFGWGAWFVDRDGKTDIPTFEHRVADHVNAAASSGLVLRRCEEPTAPASMLPDDAPLATRVAYSGTPMVLILQFDRP